MFELVDLLLTFQKAARCAEAMTIFSIGAALLLGAVTVALVYKEKNAVYASVFGGLAMLMLLLLNYIPSEVEIATRHQKAVAQKMLEMQYHGGRPKTERVPRGGSEIHNLWNSNPTGGRAGSGQDGSSYRIYQ